MSTMTLTLQAPSFSTRPGWTPAAVAKFIEESLADGCDLPGLVITEMEVDA